MAACIILIAFVAMAVGGGKRGIEAGRAYVKAWLDDSAVTRGLKRMQSGIRSVADSLGSIGQKLVGAGIGLGSLFALPLKRASMLELMTADLAVLLGSTEKAKKALEDWRKFAAETPLEFADVAELGKQLLNWKLASEDTVVEVLRQIGDASGGIPERMRSVVKALGQMRATGRIQADEMNQLTEAGLPAWEMLAKVLGTDVAGAMDMVTRRQVDAAKAVPALIQALGEFGSGRMAAMAKTLTGRLSTLKDALWEAVTPLGEALLPYAGRFVSVAAQLVDRIGAWIKANSSIAVKVAATAAAMIALGSVLITVAATMRALTFIVGGLGTLLRAVLFPATVIVTAAMKTAAAVSFAVSAAVRGMAFTVAAAAGSLRAMALAASVLSWTLTAVSLALKLFRAAAIKTRIAVALTAAATVAFGLTMRAAAVTVSLFGGALRLLGVTAAVLGGVFAALGSPIGAALVAIAAIGGAVYFAMQRSISFGDVLDWLKERFGPLAKTAKEVFNVIHDAMMAGEMAAAAKVMWASIQLAFAHGLAWVQSAWIDMQTWLASTFIDLAAQIESVWSRMSESIVNGLIAASQAALGISAALAEKLGLDGKAQELRFISSALGVAGDVAGIGRADEREEIEARRRSIQETLAEDAARRTAASTADEEAALAEAMKEARKATEEAKKLQDIETPNPVSDGTGPGMSGMSGIQQSARDAINTGLLAGTLEGQSAIFKAMGGSANVSPDGKLITAAINRQTELMNKHHKENRRKQPTTIVTEDV